MLRNGDIDFYSPPAADYGQLSQMSRVVTYRWNPADASFNFLGFNFRRKLWQDLTVRKAINSAIERAYVIKNIAEGPAVPLYSDVPPGNPAYNEDVDKPIYSLNMAQNLLLERGYRLNGYRLNGPDGKELPEISLIYNIESDTRKVLAGYIAGQLEALGFKVKSTGLDFKTFTNRLQDPEGDYDLFLSGWKPTSPDIEQFKVVWQDAIGGYKNQQLLDLYNKASREPERQTRYEVLKQVQQFEAQNLPCIYLYANQEFSGIAGIIGGVSAGPLGIKHSLYTNWFIK
jgi:peptide/nickel transport system substrate-binding protein